MGVRGAVQVSRNGSLLRPSCIDGDCYPDYYGFCTDGILPIPKCCRIRLVIDNRLKVINYLNYNIFANKKLLDVHANQLPNKGREVLEAFRITLVQIHS